jgi:hypothetical protein
MNSVHWNPPREGRFTEMPSKRGEKTKSTDHGPLNLSGAVRACGEVCPKHRKIRRESLRVRPKSGGNGSVLSGHAVAVRWLGLRDGRLREIAPKHPAGMPAQIVPSHSFHE